MTGVNDQCYARAVVILCCYLLLVANGAQISSLQKIYESLCTENLDEIEVVSSPLSCSSKEVALTFTLHDSDELDLRLFFDCMFTNATYGLEPYHDWEDISLWEGSMTSVEVKFTIDPIKAAVNYNCTVRGISINYIEGCWRHIQGTANNFCFFNFKQGSPTPATTIVSTDIPSSSSLVDSSSTTMETHPPTTTNINYTTSSSVTQQSTLITQISTTSSISTTSLVSTTTDAAQQNTSSSHGLAQSSPSHSFPPSITLPESSHTSSTSHSSSILTVPLEPSSSTPSSMSPSLNAPSSSTPSSNSQSSPSSKISTPTSILPSSNESSSFAPTSNSLTSLSLKISTPTSNEPSSSTPSSNEPSSSTPSSMSPSLNGLSSSAPTSNSQSSPSLKIFTPTSNTLKNTSSLSLHSSNSSKSPSSFLPIYFIIISVGLVIAIALLISPLCFLMIQRHKKSNSISAIEFDHRDFFLKNMDFNITVQKHHHDNETSTIMGSVVTIVQSLELYIPSSASASNDNISFYSNLSQRASTNDSTTGTTCKIFEDAMQLPSQLQQQLKRSSSVSTIINSAADTNNDNNNYTSCTSLNSYIETTDNQLITTDTSSPLHCPVRIHTELMESTIVPLDDVSIQSSLQYSDDDNNDEYVHSTGSEGYITEHSSHDYIEHSSMTDPKAAPTISMCNAQVNDYVFQKKINNRFMYQSAPSSSGYQSFGYITTDGGIV